MNDFYDVICAGAGPTGLACAIEARRAGLRSLVIDKGCLCNSIFHYPANMVFFTTPERMEIGDLPLIAAGGKPTRAEALKYYRRAAEHYELEIRMYEQVTAVGGHDGAFTIETRNTSEKSNQYRGGKLIIATGYYDQPNLLNVPGEHLPHVSHYFTESHPFWGQDVVVIGGKNSAAEAALDLFRGGARVTLVHRGAAMGKNLKYWVKPDIENRIAAAEIRALFETHVVRIGPDHVEVRNAGGTLSIPATQVFAMTGYLPNFALLEQFGVALDPETRKPACDPDTLETNVPGIYVAGVVVGGKHTGDIFIENGRFHGRQIIASLTGREVSAKAAPVSPPGE